MNRIAIVARDSLDELLGRLGTKFGVGSSTIVPFADYTDVVTLLLRHLAGHQDKLLVAGHASPDIAIAAERADLKSKEVLGASPFVSHPEDLLEVIPSKRSVVYLANPNWVTGSNYSLAQLDRIAGAIPEGALILDEKYFDFYGITGLPLLDRYDHVVVIRSLTAGFSIGSDESGCLIGTPGFSDRFREMYPWTRLTTTVFRILNTSLSDDSTTTRCLTQLRDEAMRLATGLTGLGVQNRITATDFLLLRVADPKRVGNYLAGFGTPVENLEGYPDLEHYIRYRIQSPLSNDNFLSAFRRMPTEYFKMKDVDKRAVMFHRVERPTPSGDNVTTTDRRAQRELAKER